MKSIAKSILLVSAAVFICWFWQDSAFGQNQAEKEIAEALIHSIQDGYNNEDVEKTLSIYDAKAKITGYVIGESNKEKMGAAIAGFFEDKTIIKAVLNIQEIKTEKDMTVVHAVLEVDGKNSDGSEFRRLTPMHLKMEKRETGWVVVSQHYRKDFIGVGGFESIHSFTGSPSPPASGNGESGPK